MKLLMIIYSGQRSHTVASLLEAHQVHGYTELTNAHGAGTTGRREGTRAWPGDARVFFTVIDAARADQLVSSLEVAAGMLPAGERLHAAVMPVERFF